MHITYLTLAWLTVAINAAIAVADFGRAPFVLANSAEVDVPRSWLPWLASCKAAGAVGIAVGVAADLPVLVVAASLGLTAFYLGAVSFHIRARVVYNIAFPGFFLLAAAATLALAAVNTFG